MIHFDQQVIILRTYLSIYKNENNFDRHLHF